MMHAARIGVLVALCVAIGGGCALRHETRTIPLLEPREIVWATTDDGAQLALHRYPPTAPAAGDIPVIVCHGIASNRHTWALGADRDFGAYLAARGFDTYLLELRGHGASSPADPGTTVDTYAQHDVEAAIEAVRAHTGAQQVAWVGHSMGGLVLIAYLADHPDPPLAAAVTVASPVDWRDPDRMTRLMRRALDALHGPLPARALTAFYARWDGFIPHDLDRIVYAPANMTRDALADMMRVGTSPIQDGVRRQFAASIAAGSFVSADGGRRYLDAAPSIRVPFLVVAGRDDLLCPPERTITFHDRLGSPDRSWRVFGVDHGDAVDYGHVDLCNGDHAAEDVYPFLADWLAARVGAR